MAPGQLSFDVAIDRIVAAGLLRGQTWAVAWGDSDRGGFDLSIAAVVDTAHAIARAAFAVPPAQRAQHWEHARRVLSLQGVGTGALGARERLLSRVALEWAAAAPTPATDALFSLHPAGWVALQAGGPDRLTRNVLEQHASDTPCLWLDADVDPAEPFAALPSSTQVRLAVCDDFEAEAQRSAALVLHHVQRGELPVALVAHDRLLVRRVRALLGRQGVSLRDETGWKLSTTRAGASVRNVLVCAREDASTDDWLDWIKAWPRPAPGAAGLRQALDDLEHALRKRKLRHARGVDDSALGTAAATLWRRAGAALRPLATLGLAAGSGWVSALAECLRATGQHAALEADDAGRQLLAALHWAPVDMLLASAPDAERLDLDAFSAWLDSVLEQTSFLPESSGTAAVVITPMARAMLRSFEAVVFPGADERQLGAASAPDGLLNDGECAALGLPDAQARHDAEIRAFAQVLRLPRLTLLHRAGEDGEPLAVSPWVEWLRLALARRGDPSAWGIAADPRGTVELALTPVARPLPRAPALLPPQLSASACEALRACPYRFFALRLLRLGTTEELDGELQKRDYGTWLHTVLQRFHIDRVEPMAAEVEAARLHDIGREVLRERGLDEAEFLPYASSFARLMPRYLDWLHKRDAAGARWLDAECELSAQPPEWAPVQMHGVIDRVDSIVEKGVPITQLIDYKTGQGQALRDAVNRGEDTQLPFYAALMDAQSEASGDISAIYLMLDESNKLLPIPHPDVQLSAAALVEGIGRDLSRIAAGASLPALGEGQACDYCDARGLCRRDHWAAEAMPAK